MASKAPSIGIMWLSKKHNLVKTLTFESEFTAIKLAVELIIVLKYELRMFGVKIEGPTDMFCENKVVFKNTSTPEYLYRKKNHST